MKFCPTCDVRLKKDSNTLVLTCPKCNYTEGGQKTEKQSLTQFTQDTSTLKKLNKELHNMKMLALKHVLNVIIVF